MTTVKQLINSLKGMNQDLTVCLVHKYGSQSVVVTSINQVVPLPFQPDGSDEETLLIALVDESTRVQPQPEATPAEPESQPAQN